MRKSLMLLPLLLAFGCDAGRPRTPGDNPVIGGPQANADGGSPADSHNIPNCDPSNVSQGGDQDGDGYTPAQGDCNDCNPTINPGAIQIPGDSTDYACNGMPGVVAACDTSVTGMRDATSLAAAMDLCDPRFLTSAMLVGPSDQRARKAVASFGVLSPRAGKAMSLVSNGIAADKSDTDFDHTNEEDPGTNLSDSNSYQNPLPNLAGVSGCSQSQPGTVNDYTELVLKLKAPTNVNSFSFDFQFFSAEYPVYVCTEFNDEFLVLQESQSEFPQASNIAFDMQNNAITINSGFFTVCTNDTTKPQTQNCKMPVSGIAGTGFDDHPAAPPFNFPGLPQDLNIPGGSTGWLTTTSPVTPGEIVTLHFIIFDEGDHVLDSASLIDNFRWGTSVVTTPTTQPIL